MQRLFKFLVISLCIVTLTAPDAEAAQRKKTKAARPKAPIAAGIKDPRYADLIMNPQTGEIYHQDDADGKRYPASLTKMMTLYLLFEALETKKISLSKHLDVSYYASTMPQTNLALEEGDSIPVETAIKALVVRSANDVSVVVAEALGGDVDHFAQMMTSKARALGMRNTVFKNPNGLPNSGQYTTARDMAKLGIALKRDFPRYYPYFATRQFSWNGATYYTHNRVMLRYPGTDGIKTGFIGASGFNLVSSVTRGGRPLVGVVMGGSSGAWRDNRMIQLLDESYKIVAARGATRGKASPENLPTSKTGKSSGVAAQAEGMIEANAVQLDSPAMEEEETGVPEGVVEESEAAAPLAPVTSAQVAAPVPMAQPAPATAQSYVRVVNPSEANAPKESYIKIIKPVPAPAVAIPSGPKVVTVPAQTPSVGAQRAPSTSAVAPAPASTVSAAPKIVAHPAHGGISNWGIQVGAFSSKELAERAALQAQQLAQTVLAGSRMEIAGPENNGAPVHRARLTNLSQVQARDACEKLIANNTPCFIFKSGN